MRSPRLRSFAVSTVAATAIAGAALADRAAAGDNDDDRDKNVLLAEAQFQLHLVTADFVPSDITCTRPPVRDVAGELLCYALISDRVSVAAIASMVEPGEYEFVPLNKVDPADLVPSASNDEDATLPEPPPVIPEAPEPTEPESGDAQNIADEAILATIGAAIADEQGLGRVLTDNNQSIASLDDLAYDAFTSTMQVAVSTSVVDPAIRDGVAFFVTDVMAYLWVETEPTRDPEATIQPRLEVTVDGVLYGSPFEVMVDVADYAITEGEWLEIVTGNAAFAPASQRAIGSPQKAAALKIAEESDDKSVNNTKI